MIFATCLASTSDISVKSSKLVARLSSLFTALIWRNRWSGTSEKENTVCKWKLFYYSIRLLLPKPALSHDYITNVTELSSTNVIELRSLNPSNWCVEAGRFLLLDEKTTTLVPKIVNIRFWSPARSFLQFYVGSMNILTEWGTCKTGPLNLDVVSWGLLQGMRAASRELPAPAPFRSIKTNLDSSVKWTSCYRFHCDR